MIVIWSVKWLSRWCANIGWVLTACAQSRKRKGKKLSKKTDVSHASD